MKKTIQFYANRKLYDLETKTYVTLKGIANFLTKGGSVQIMDHVTNTDITLPTLLKTMKYVNISLEEVQQIFVTKGLKE